MLTMSKEKPSRRKPPVRTGKAISLYIPVEVHDALMRFVDAQRVPPSKTDVLILALTEFLEREGFDPYSEK